ncbi:MAG: polysaccharide deacetylase family protein [Thermodesulfobacteriota bacterium]
MDKKYFLRTLSSNSFRGLLLLLLALAVVFFSGLNKTARSTDVVSEDLTPLKNEIISGITIETGILTPSQFIKAEKPTTLASNVPVPERITRTGIKSHKMIRYIPATPPNITRGNIHGTRISVTFDGGFSAEQATEILNILRERNIKTTIFLSGVFIRKHPRITRMIVADGHEVGNHTTTHPHLTELEINGTQKTKPHVTKDFLIKELKIAEKRFFEVTGRHMSPLWRAPYGEVNKELRAWAFSAGYLHIGWTYDRKNRRSLDSLDWVHDRSSHLYHTPEEIKERILSFDDNGGNLGGGIVLMHLGTNRSHDRASSILGEILDDLLKKGLSVVKVSDLILNKRLLREANLKKVRYYQADTRKDKKTSPQRFKIQVKATPLRG